MTNYQQLYWLTRLDAIQGFLIAGLTIASIIVFISHIWLFTEGEWEKPETVTKVRKTANRLLFIVIPFSLALVFLPTKRDVILIYAGGKTMDFVQSDTSINKIPSQTTKIITDYLENKIKEAQNNNIK